MQHAARTRQEKLPTVPHGLLVVTLVVHLVVFMAPSWYSGDNGQAGLWRWCIYSPPECHTNLQHHNDAQKAGCALMVISLAGLLLGTISCVIYNCGKAENTTIRLQVIGLFTAAACSILSLVLWGYDFGAFREVLGGRISLRWAYLMAIFSCVLTTAVGMMAMFTLYLSHKDDFESKMSDIKYCQEGNRRYNQSSETSAPVEETGGPRYPRQRIQEGTTAQHAKNIPGRYDQASRKIYKGNGLNRTGKLEADGAGRDIKENTIDEDSIDEDKSPKDGSDKERQHSESKDDFLEGESEDDSQHKKTNRGKKEKKKTKKKEIFIRQRRVPENQTPVYDETPENC